MACDRDHFASGSIRILATALAILASIPSAAAAETEYGAPGRLATASAARAAAVSGPIISVQPLTLDFGIVTIGTTEARSYTVQNTGDEDLEISDVMASDPQIATNQPVPMTLRPGSAYTGTATCTPTGGAAGGTLEFHSNAANGVFSILVRGQGNHAPVIDPIGPIAATAWIPIQFAVHVSDLDGDPIVLSAEGLPSGASFDDATGTYSWTPTADDGGAHAVTITASDGHASASLDVTITVTVLNHRPVADPGGPYVGTVGLPLSFDGSGSSDPDGGSLAFHWTFGDGGTGSGVRPTHVYDREAIYAVALEVVDDGIPNLSGTASTFATVSIGGDQITLPAVQDNTIYSESDSSYGAGWCLLVGRPTQPRPGQQLIRRVLIRFDLRSIPAGNRIVSARLNLYRLEQGGPGTRLRVFRLLQDWGEGTSGAGDPCTPPPRQIGRAPTDSASTWNHRFFGTGARWETETGVPLPGGSFRTAYSDSAFISAAPQRVGLESRGITSDVTDWIQDPASNHGWILLGDEENLGTGMRFASREDTLASRAPSLTISFAPQAGACCMPDGTCVLTTPEECEARSGRYGGDNSTCEEQICLEPFVDWLPTPAVATPVRGRAGGAAHYEIAMREIRQQLHRDLPPTTLWGYDGRYPGPTIEAYRDQPVQVRWINDLRDYDTGLPRSDHYFDVDTRIHGPDMMGKTPRTVVHLHGGAVPSEYDGFPESTFVAGGSRLYRYPNRQLPATLWYHDHALGITRYNVMMGLAGFYLIRDRREEALPLPSGRYEIPLLIQDRSFNTDGSLRYPAEWVPMFLGDKVLVNGKVWPKLRVDQGKYRFRVLNGSNHRIFTLTLSDRRPFHVIGSDGGLLSSPVEKTEITIGPAERADLVLDFQAYPPGAEVLLLDTLESGQMDASDPTASRVMKFVVAGDPGWTAPLPLSLEEVPRIPESQASRTRTFRLRFDQDLQRFLLGDFGWDAKTVFPTLGSTEIWAFANETSETHPIHIHLIEFQVLDRSSFQIVDGEVVPGSDRRAPGPEEAGWKDTANVGPGELLRVIMRFAPDGFLGDYVFHCHMLEHEDNEMMRQFTVVPPNGRKPTVVTGRMSPAIEGHRTPVRVFTTGLGLPRVEGAAAVVEYTLAQPGEVTLAVFDVAGRRVAGLAGGARGTGVHRASLDLRQVAHGIYFVRMRTGGKVFVRRMPVLRTSAGPMR